MRYSDPYIVGTALGLTLLASFLTVGHGLGASGGFSSVVASATALATTTERASTSPALAPYLTEGIASPLTDWFVVELAGVCIGGFCSAGLAGRIRRESERGPRLTIGARSTTALFGGVLMGFGAKLARGCTSGQGLTGGALLSVGSWVFMAACFATAYLAAPAARRLWR